MATLKLKPRQPAEEIENWDDDDDFLLDGDDLSKRNSTTSANAPSRRRDSASSHVSFRSEVDSVQGEERQVNIPGDDDSSATDAIAAAQSSGIPLPKNVPTSALMGGTIKRLGGRKLQKIIQEDWENDLELPESSKGLAIKTQDNTDFPDALRQVSAGSVQGSPTKPTKSPAAASAAAPAAPAAPAAKSTTSALTSAINLDKFKDTDEDEDLFGDGVATIRVPRGRQPSKPVSFITPPTPQKDQKTKVTDDDFEQDLELPSSGKLTLSTRRDIPKTPSTVDDLDWGEGSLGTRFGGTRRDGRSNRSSSASALSPSVSSSITAESEDETMDGLLLPDGPLNFQERLQRRKKSPSPARLNVETNVTSNPSTKASPPKQHAEPERPDMADGLDLGEGDVFDSGKLTLHRNIKVKESQPASPARPKTAVSLTFTNKPQSRLPRLSHERSHSTALEPVSESGGPIQQQSRRSRSRLGHASQNSTSSVPTPTTTNAPPFPPATPRRREITTRSSFSTLRNDASNSNTQLLRQKRSLPAVRPANSPVKPSGTHRPPSRDNNRPQSGMRPKTPVERIRHAESPSLARKNPMPFLPAGASQNQSQHASSKGMRQFRRWDSDNAIDMRPTSRSYSRSNLRSPSPRRYKVAEDTWERLSKPKNKKNFGDGHELDAFDDLPTSKESETRYLRTPITTGPKASLRNKVHQNVMPDRTATPAPSSPAKGTAASSATPRFARDTAASRIARETSKANRVPTNGPLAAVSAQRGPPLASKTNLNPQLPSQNVVRSKKQSKRPQQLKPHLIANLNSGKESKVVNGMYYNAETFQWEGNENALNAFDHQQSPVPTSDSAPREKETSTPRPALITNISGTKGVQVVGGMVFDPQNMCWVKLDQRPKAKSEASDTLDGFDALDDDEDVFKDIPDLDDNGADTERGGEGRISDVKDDWLVGEEFDVGPEFVRRQREEEDRWRRKCDKWIGREARDRETWRWTIRELVTQFDDLAV